MELQDRSRFYQQLNHDIVSLIPHAIMAKHSRQTLFNMIQSSVSRQIGVVRMDYAQRLIALSQSKPMS